MMAIAAVLLSLLLCYCQAEFQACSLCSCDLNNGKVRCEYIEKFPEVSGLPINTTTLEILYSNLSSGIPTDDLQQLPNLRYLTLVYNTVKNITKFGPLNLIETQIDHNTLEHIETGAFDSLRKLSKLSLNYNKLKSFPSFKKPSEIKELLLRGNIGIKTLSRQSLQNLPLLQNLDLEETGITSISDGMFESNKQLLKIDLAGVTSLQSIHDNAFGAISSIQTLILDKTRITSLPKQGLGNLRYLSLKDVPNFWQLPLGLWNMQEVHLSQYNGFLCCAFDLNVYNKDCTTRLKNRGEKTTTKTAPSLITTLQPQQSETTTKNSGLWTWPTWPSGPQTTPSSNSSTGGGGWWPTWPSRPQTTPSSNSSTGGGGWWPTWPSGPQTTPSSNSSAGGGEVQQNATQPTTPSANSTSGGGGWWPGNFKELLTNTTQQPSVTTSGGWWPGGGGGGGGGGFGTPPSSAPTHQVNTYTHVFTFPDVHNTTVVPPTKIHTNKTNATVYQCPNEPIQVKCFPQPDAFHPCEDVMGYTLLTVVSFFVGLVAVLANLVVAVVLLTSERRLNVTRFLMCNLAFADFCLGLYILILTCYSIETHGKYYNYVRTWQYGAGCKILGFLAVFSSELSLFSLVLMTIERFYAIVYAMHLNARLSFRWAVRSMSFGWLFAVIIAALPLLGVNSYEKVAVCLPFDVSTAGNTAYVALILLLNGVSFFLVVYLYGRMLFVVMKGGGMEGAPKRNDSKVAKRMAVLVFTDMACWAPIAFFGLLAAFGAPLINVTESKILIVFFFPINSLCNPFLYAFFTKAFKREFFTLLSRFGFCKFRALKYNGTLSSILYSRSRRNQSQDDRSKRISTVSSPSINLDDKFKRISTVSSPSFNDFKRSTPDLNNTDSNPRKTVESIQMNGITNKAYSPEEEERQVSPGTKAKFAKTSSNNEDDDVFISTSPKPPSTNSSPKSILKKTSTIDNSYYENSERDKDVNDLDDKSKTTISENIENEHINGVINCACDGKSEEDSKTSTSSGTTASSGNMNSPKFDSKKGNSVMKNELSDDVETK